MLFRLIEGRELGLTVLDSDETTLALNKEVYILVNFEGLIKCANRRWQLRAARIRQGDESTRRSRNGGTARDGLRDATLG